MVRPLPNRHSHIMADSGEHPSWLDVAHLWSRRLQHVDRCGMRDRSVNYEQTVEGKQGAEDNAVNVAYWFNRWPTGGEQG